MSVIRIMTNFNIELEFPAAPFHRRLLAWLLDIIILFIITRVSIELINLAGKRSSGTNLSNILSVILVIFLLSYHLICEVLMNGQSLGKKNHRPPGNCGSCNRKTSGRRPAFRCGCFMDWCAHHR